MNIPFFSTGNLSRQTVPVISYRYMIYNIYFVFHLDERYSALRFLRSLGFLSTTSINRLGDINIGVTDTVRGYSIIYFIWLLYLWKIFLAVSEHIYFYLMYFSFYTDQSVPISHCATHIKIDILLVQMINRLTLQLVYFNFNKSYYSFRVSLYRGPRRIVVMTVVPARMSSNPLYRYLQINNMAIICPVP